MKAKYKHRELDCIVYDQVICEDNIVVTVRTFKGHYKANPETFVKVCSTNAVAHRVFSKICAKFDKAGYECEYAVIRI